MAVLGGEKKQEREDNLLPAYLDWVCEDNLRQVISFLTVADAIRFSQCKKGYYALAYKTLDLARFWKIGFLRFGHVESHETFSDLMQRLFSCLASSDAEHVAKKNPFERFRRFITHPNSAIHPFFTKTPGLERPIRIKVRGIGNLSSVRVDPKFYWPLIYSYDSDIVRKFRPPRFPSVTSLDLSEADWAQLDFSVKYYLAEIFRWLFPNVKYLDIPVDDHHLAYLFDNKYKLKGLTFRGPQKEPEILLMWSKEALQANLQDLTVEGVVLCESEVKRIGLFPHCSKLAYVNIRNVHVAERSQWKTQRKRLSDAQIAQFVREKPSLRWLRSDLSDQAVALLQKERPDVIFVR